MFSAIDAPANYTLALTFRACVGVLQRVFMALRTGCFAAVDDTDFAAPNVFQIRYRFQVIRVAARPVPACVVRHQIVREGTVLNDVCEAVHEHLVAIRATKSAVPFLVQSASPYHAFTLRNQSRLKTTGSTFHFHFVCLFHGYASRMAMHSATSASCWPYFFSKRPWSGWTAMRRSGSLSSRW